MGRACECGRPVGVGRWCLACRTNRCSLVFAWSASSSRQMVKCVHCNLFIDPKVLLHPSAVAVPGASVHWYGKAGVAPQRKIG